MAATSIVLGVLVLAICVAWYAWASDKLEPREARHGFSGTQVSSTGMPVSEDEGYQVTESPPDVTGKSGHLMGEPPPESKYVISKDYRIKYSRRVYVSTPFELTVAFVEPGTLRKSEPKLTVRDGRVLFQSPDPEPPIKVALLFAPGTFESNETAQEKRLKKRGSTAFSFWLKPLRSEDCLLTVSISYAAQEQVPEQLEQIQISTVQEDYGQQKTTTTLVKTPRTLHWTYRPLDQVTLNVSAAGFLRLNARELDLLSKGLGALIAFFLVTLSFVTGRALDWAQAVELVVLGVATPLGLTFYDGLKGTLKAPKPEESS